MQENKTKQNKKMFDTLRNEKVSEKEAKI